MSWLRKIHEPSFGHFYLHLSGTYLTRVIEPFTISKKRPHHAHAVEIFLCPDYGMFIFKVLCVAFSILSVCMILLNKTEYVLSCSSLDGVTLQKYKVLGRLTMPGYVHTFIGTSTKLANVSLGGQVFLPLFGSNLHGSY